MVVGDRRAPGVKVAELIVDADVGVPTIFWRSNPEEEIATFTLASPRINASATRSALNWGVLVAGAGAIFIIASLAYLIGNSGTPAVVLTQGAPAQSAIFPVRTGGSLGSTPIKDEKSFEVNQYRGAVPVPGLAYTQNWSVIEYDAAMEA